MRRSPSRFAFLLVACALQCAAFSAAAQGYPNRPIIVVSPWPAGGGADAVGRPMMQKLSEALGQSVVYDSKSGSNGEIGSAYVAKAKPDGYTLLYGAMSPNMIAHAANRKLPYDTLKDFAPIGQVTGSSLFLVVGSHVPAKSVQELITYAKANPGKLTYGSSGVASSPHLAAEKFLLMSGTRMLHVPYKGSGPMMVDMVGGQVDVSIASLGVVAPHLATGKIRMLGTVSDKRASTHPELPTVGETVPGYNFISWYGMFAPAGTPKEIVDMLNAQFRKILAQPEMMKLLVANGHEAAYSTPDEFSRKIAREIRDWRADIAKMGLKIE